MPYSQDTSISIGFFARQVVYTGQKLSESVEVGVAFRRNQFLYAFLACIVPFLRDPRRVLRCGCGNDPGKSCFLHEPFIRARRTVEVKADRATVAMSLAEIIPPITRASLNNIRAPGFSTRNISTRTSGLPGRWHKTSLENTASIVSPSKGRFFETSHCSKRAREPRTVLCASSFALRIPGSLISCPTIWQPDLSARSKAYLPRTATDL